MSNEGVEPRAYQAAFHLISEAAAFVDLTGMVLAMNPAFGKLITGPEPEKPRLVEVFLPPEASRVEALLRDAVRWSEASMRGAQARASPTDLVDLWANSFVGAEGQRLLLVRAHSASARLQAERLHDAAVLAARACNEASSWSALSEGVDRVVARLVPGVSGTSWLRRDDDGWSVVGGYGTLASWRAGDRFSKDSLWTRFAAGREAVLLADVRFELRSESDAAEARIPPGSLIAAPILAEGTVESLLVTVGRREAEFSLDDVRCVEALAREMASSIMRLEAREALTRSHTELMRAFQENKVLLERVRRLNTELEDFALWTTHDLREPLRGLATLAEFVADGAAARNDSDLADLAKQLASFSTKLKGQIRGLHEFHEQARDSEIREPVGFHDLVRASVARVEPARATLTIVGADANLVVDPSRIARAIRDMVEYALAQGPGAVKVEADRADEVWARVAVALAEEVTRRAAESAFHVVGEGQALALARRIAIQHGGTLSFEQRDGSWLTLTLPLVG